MAQADWPSNAGRLAGWLVFAADAIGVATASPESVMIVDASTAADGAQAATIDLAQPPAGQAAQCPDRLNEEIPGTSTAEDQAWHGDGQLRESGDDACSVPYPSHRMPHQSRERARPEYPGTLVLRTESVEEAQEYCETLARSAPEVALSDPVCMIRNNDIVPVPMGPLPQHPGLDRESLVPPDAEGWDFLRRWRHVPPRATQRDGQSSRASSTG